MTSKVSTFNGLGWYRCDINSLSFIFFWLWSITDTAGLQGKGIVKVFYKYTVFYVRSLDQDYVETVRLGVNNHTHQANWVPRCNDLSEELRLLSDDGWVRGSLEVALTSTLYWLRRVKTVKQTINNSEIFYLTLNFINLNVRDNSISALMIAIDTTTNHSYTSCPQVFFRTCYQQMFLLL
jgi:hypothetical protein